MGARCILTQQNTKFLRKNKVNIINFQYLIQKQNHPGSSTG